MERIKITDKRFIGKNEPCFIIAEIGSNHNRSLSMAKELICAVAESKADAVKFQLFKGDRHYSRRTPYFSRFRENVVDLLNRISLPISWLEDLKEYAQKKGVIFFSSVTDYEEVDLLEKLSISLYKLASFELVDLGLIEYIAKTRKPIILSTGMANMSEINDAYQVCIKNKNRKIILLQCTSAYPAPYNIVNLKSIETLKKRFRVPIGFSDHTLGMHIALGAVALGAKVIEKHFTLNRKLKGPDHSFAMEPSELKNMVMQIRYLESAFGDGKKSGPAKEEMEHFQKCRRSIHANTAIKANVVIEPDMVTVKRPGFGIKPKFLNMLVGKRTKRNIEVDEWITWNMVK